MEGSQIGISKPLEAMILSVKLHTKQCRPYGISGCMLMAKIAYAKDS